MPLETIDPNDFVLHPSLLRRNLPSSYVQTDSQSLVPRASAVRYGTMSSVPPATVTLSTNQIARKLRAELAEYKPTHALMSPSGWSLRSSPYHVECHDIFALLERFYPWHKQHHHSSISTSPHQDHPRDIIRTVFSELITIVSNIPTVYSLELLD